MLGSIGKTNGRKEEKNGKLEKASGKRAEKCVRVTTVSRGEVSSAKRPEIDKNQRKAVKKKVRRKQKRVLEIKTSLCQNREIRGYSREYEESRK